MPPLVGRESETARIAGLVDATRGGLSGVLVLRGDPGAGKTALLDAAETSASGFAVLRLGGIESEMQLGFAGLHQLLTPFLGGIDLLPPPQRRALRAVFGICDDAPPDQFLVGLAALTLLSNVATRRPMLVVVDDGQWLDEESANALGFVARRLYADRICMLVALREPMDHRLAFEGLPSLTLEPLSEGASIELLEAAVEGPLADHVHARLLADACGNPLALLELGRELSPDQRAGAAQLPEPLAVGQRLEQRFLRLVTALPPPTQRFLLVAAAEPTGDSTTVWRSGRELDFDEDAILPAQAEGLIDVGPPIRFRHSLIRSAVYQGASDADRCRTHQALADATDPARDPDRRAWHRAAAARAPDEDVAAELERAATRAGKRGGCTASAALLARAAHLTPDPSSRAIRFLGAAVADLSAGSSERAHANLTLALPDLHDAVLVAQARRLEAAILFIDAAPDAPAGRGTLGRLGEIVSIMVDAALALGPLDIRLARETILDAIPLAIFFGDSSSMSCREVGRAMKSLMLPSDAAPTSVDLVYVALAEVFAEGFGGAVPLLRNALAATRANPEVRKRPRRMAVACWVAFALSDDEALEALAGECAAGSRERGALQVLPEVLSYLGQRELRVGSLAAADDLFIEQNQIQAVLGRHGPGEADRLIVTAWRGREVEVRAAAPALAAEAQDLGIGLVVALAQYALMVLELGLGNYQAASAFAQADLHQDLALGAFRAADAIEANVRGGDRATAKAILAWLTERAVANGSDLDLGLMARSQALLTEDSDAEAHFRDSIAHLESAGALLHRARTQLLYGEWLRRQKRRRDARAQLGPALDVFESTGANGFAERARIELLATGATARRRVDETRHDLTPQEMQIARLAAEGATNPEIAARLFISSSTVDYHLRKVYRKLDIKSRRELEGTVTVAR